MIDESMQSGRSQRPCTIGTARPMSPISSASGSPTLTSSMSAPPATWAATSISSCDRSPSCSCAWNALRPVGLIRSPMTTNGWSGPMMTVLDGDRTTVCTCLPRRNAESPAEAGDAGLAPEADEVKAGDAGKRTRLLGELARHLETLGLGGGGALAACDRLHRDGDAGDLLVDVAERRRSSHEADGRNERAAVHEARLHRVRHERREPLGLEAHLQLQEARTCAYLLERAVDAVVVRRRTRVLDRPEEEVRRGTDVAAGEVGAVRHLLRRDEKLNGVEVEDTPRLGLVAGGDVVTGEAEDVLDPVQRGAGELGLQREAVAVAAGELHDGLHPELPQRDRNRERRRVRVRRGVVRRVRRVDVLLVRRELLLDSAGIDREQLRGDDEASGRERFLKPGHSSPSASACRAWSRD